MKKYLKEAIRLVSLSFIILTMSSVGYSWYGSLPAVYFSASTRKPVDAEVHGKSVDLEKALEGRYKKVWVP